MSVNEDESTIPTRATQHCKCSPDAVYDAWLEPDHIRVWMSNALKSLGLSGKVKRVEVDARVSGKFCFSDIRSDTEAVHHREYLELIQPSRIVFTWMVGEQSNEDMLSRVTLMIGPEGSGCVTTLIHEMDAKWAEYVPRTENGWKRMLIAVAELVGSST